MSETKRGEFWIDGDDTHKVQGTLTYGSDILSTLELSGHLEDHFSTAPMQNILGILEGQQCVTLRDCLVTYSAGFPDMPGATQKFICNRVFKGKLMFPNAEQINAESLTVSMWPLAEWSREKDLVEFDWSTPIREHQSANFLPDECISIQGCRSGTLDFTVEIWRSAGLSAGSNEKGRWLKAEPRSWFRLVPASAEIPVESLVPLVHILQMMLAMLVNVPAVVNHVYFRSSIDVEPEPDWMRNMEFFAQWERDARGEDDTRIRIYDSVYMDQVEGDVIREWFKLYDDYHPAVNWLLSHFFNPRIPVDMRFDVAFKAVERLLSQHLGTGRPGRKGGYKQGESRASATSLVQFVEHTGLSDTRYFKDMDCAARRKWASRVMEMRDKHTAHLDWRGTLQSPEGEEFYQQAKVLTCLGVGFLMAQMNIPRTVITEVLGRRLM